MFALLAALPLLVFHGNVALLEDVYRSALELPAGTRASPVVAKQVAGKLRHFLHKAGYALAVVHARVEGEQIAIDIDEGRLDKVIFLGGGAFETLRLRLELHIQNEVFNKPDLERQLNGLARRLGLAEFAYEVVPVASVVPQQGQLDDIEPLEDLSLGFVRPGRPYELRILVQPGTFRAGVSPELEIDSIEGGGIGATYHGGRLLARDDRFNLGFRVAGAVRQRLELNTSYFTFTRALGEAEYEAPPIGGVLRPSLRARADLSDRQRGDLRLEKFMFATLDAAAQLVFVPIAHLRASAAGGMERRLIFGAQAQAGATPLPGPQYSFAQTRPYTELALQLTFDPESVRRDRHHQLGLGARLYSPPHEDEKASLHLSANYQKMWLRGWNELWLEARALARMGAVVFPEELSIGDGGFLRGPFGGNYTRRVAGLDLEYRYSLLRDVFKLGVFHNFVAYGNLDRITGVEKVALADALGLGLHALMIDEFQLDAYFGVGWGSGGRFGSGAALFIRQAF